MMQHFDRPTEAELRDEADERRYVRELSHGARTVRALPVIDGAEIMDEMDLAKAVMHLDAGGVEVRYPIGTDAIWTGGEREQGEGRLSVTLLEVRPYKGGWLASYEVKS